jgi:hypothetical protein
MGTPATLRSLFRQYLDALPKIGVDACSGPGEWTRHVKEWWAKKGTEYGFQVWANGLGLKNPKFKNKEFMVDLLWEIDSNRTALIQMALECEWNTSIDDILWDFCKLVYVKARRKVMIFQVPLRKEPDPINEFTSVVRRCRIKQEPAEKYLLIRHKDRRPEPNQLMQLIRGYIVDQNGSIEPLGDEREVIIP